MRTNWLTLPRRLRILLLGLLLLPVNGAFATTMPGPGESDPVPLPGPGEGGGGNDGETYEEWLNRRPDGSSQGALQEWLARTQGRVEVVAAETMADSRDHKILRP